ncbi:hypothetical protein D3C75_1124720 [compost metagenome]
MVNAEAAAFAGNFSYKTGVGISPESGGTVRIQGKGSHIHRHLGEKIHLGLGHTGKVQQHGQAGDLTAGGQLRVLAVNRRVKKNGCFSLRLDRCWRWNGCRRGRGGFRLPEAQRGGIGIGGNRPFLPG